VNSADENSNLIQGVLIDNRYEVLELLKTSEQEVLLRALDKTLENEKILLKVFHVSKETSASDLKRFRNEVIISRKLAHPNICRVYDLGRFQKNYYYITLEDREGHSLEEVLSETLNKGLPFKLVVDIVYQVANALVESHSQGVIHRKLSSENVLFSLENGNLNNVYITGFGYGRIEDKDFGLTRTGELVGTPAYMAPEQLRCEEVDLKSDIYALGILAFEMLTCKKPYGEDVSSVLKSMQPNVKMPEVSTFREDVPIWFSDLIKKASAKDKADRYLSAKDLRDDILFNLKISKSLKRVNQTSFISSVKDFLLKSKKLFISFTLLSLLALGGFKYYPYILNFLIGTPLPTELTTIDSQNIFSKVLSGDEPGVFKALKDGTSANIKDKSGTPLICLAANLGKVNIVYTLLEHDPSVVDDTDQNGRTALMLAILKNKKDVIDLLVASNANLKVADKTGLSALDYAKSKNIKLKLKK